MLLSYFKNEYNMINPISVNRFIINYLNIVDGEIKIGRGVIKNMNLTKKNCPKKGFHLNDKKKKIISNDINIKQTKINEIVDVTFDARCLIKNGNTCDPINIDKKLVKFTMTCAFDSISELIISCFNRSSFKNIVDIFLQD